MSITLLGWLVDALQKGGVNIAGIENSAQEYRDRYPDLEEAGKKWVDAHLPEVARVLGDEATARASLMAAWAKFTGAEPGKDANAGFGG